MSEQEQLIADQAELEAFARSGCSNGLVAVSLRCTTEQHRRVVSRRRLLALPDVQAHMCVLYTALYVLQEATSRQAADRALERRPSRDSRERRH